MRFGHGALVIVLIAAAEPALAACSDPPAPPINLRVEALRFRPDLNPRATAITLHWENRASESRVCFEVEATGPNNFRRVDHTSTCGPGGKGWPKSLNFLNLTPDTRYCFKARAWTGSLGGDCKSPWSATVCGSTVPGFARECRQYADRAVDAARRARTDYRCDAAAITGARWTATHQQHMDWCMGASVQARNAENAARSQQLQRCLVQARRPNITVTQSRGGDDYFLNGTGFAANAPVTIRVGGPAAGTVNITVVNRQRILANASGAISVRLFGAMFCKRGGDITFAAQDGDGPLSNVVNSKCNP